jgi:hypothetical protein
MSRSIVATAGAVLLVSATAARPAHAMTGRDLVKAHVPFAFQVEGRPMPAGDYELKALDANHPDLIEIRSTSRGESPVVVLVVPKDSGSVRKAQMVFDDVGREKFLRAVRLPGEEGFQLLVANAELQAAREVAAEATRTPSASTH